jgi:hypothetical protein
MKTLKLIFTSIIFILTTIYFNNKINEKNLNVKKELSRLQLEISNKSKFIEILEQENLKLKKIISYQEIKPQNYKKTNINQKQETEVNKNRITSSEKLDNIKSSIPLENKNHENLFQVHIGYGRTSTSIEETPYSFSQKDEYGFLYGVGYSRLVLSNTYIGFSVFSNKDVYFNTTWGF